MFKVGQKVQVPWWEFDCKSMHKVPDLIGKIIKIDGAYHYIKVENNSKYNILELYDSEFTAIQKDK